MVASMALPSSFILSPLNLAPLSRSHAIPTTLMQSKPLWASFRRLLRPQKCARISSFSVGRVAFAWSTTMVDRLSSAGPRPCFPRHRYAADEVSPSPRQHGPPVLRAILLTWFLFSALPFLLIFGVALFFVFAGHRPA